MHGIKLQILIGSLAVLGPFLGPYLFYQYYRAQSYREPENAWKCIWVEPIDPADKRACVAIPDKWLGDQFARCMVKLGYTRRCPDEVKP